MEAVGEAVRVGFLSSENISGRRSAIDKRMTRHPGYAKSLRIRRRVEEAFGWIKSAGGPRQTKLQRARQGGLGVHLVAAADNLVRLPKLIGAMI